MEFSIIKTIVSSFVFVFLLFIIANHVINTWFSGNLNESDRNLIEKFETDMSSATTGAPSATTGSATTATTGSATATTASPSATGAPSATTAAPSASPVIDYSTENSENTANLFDKVNAQLDMIRTLKEPYSEIVKTVDFNRDLSGNMLILSNLKTLVNAGIAINDKDLQTNPGIVKLFQYGGNDSIAEIITDMATLNEEKLTELCSKFPSECEKISSTSDRASCMTKTQKQCIKQIEASYIKRISTIVEGHQRIIDRILKKVSSV
jgi:hypothetical protein